jgi:hypothetical protein
MKFLSQHRDAMLFAKIQSNCFFKKKPLRTLQGGAIGALSREAKFKQDVKTQVFTA